MLTRFELTYTQDGKIIRENVDFLYQLSHKELCNWCWKMRNGLLNSYILVPVIKEK